MTLSLILSDLLVCKLDLLIQLDILSLFDVLLFVLFSLPLATVVKMAEVFAGNSSSSDSNPFKHTCFIDDCLAMIFVLWKKVGNEFVQTLTFVAVYFVPKLPYCQVGCICIVVSL
jgi:hypothetical protein